MSLFKHRSLLMIIWCMILLSVFTNYSKASDIDEVPVQTVETDEIPDQVVESVPVIAPTQLPELKLTEKKQYGYVNTYVRVRKEASKKSAQKILLEPGQKVQVIKKENGWAEVKKKNITGYVRTSTLENEKSEAMVVAKKKKVKYSLTGYCPCYKCSEGFGRQTCSGRKAKANHTIAADLSVLPLYTDVYIEGMGIYTVEDRGHSVRGRHIDVYCNQHYQCYDLKASANVFVIE